MSDEKGQHEPSMEEILASIRRIIAEDETPEGEADANANATAAGAPPAAAAAESPEAAANDDVLELTEVVEEEQAVANPAEAPAPSGPEPDLLKLEPEPLPEESAAQERERLISAASAAASVASLSQLVARPREKGAELPLGDMSRTLEDMVRELIRPMLKGWIDDNLPPLVERLVREEITRLVREAESR